MDREGKFILYINILGWVVDKCCEIDCALGMSISDALTSYSLTDSKLLKVMRN